MGNYMLMFESDKLVPKGCTISNFQFDMDSCRSTSRFVFTFGGSTVSQRSMKQSCIVDFIMKVEYVIASEATKEVAQLRKFLMELRVVPLVVQMMILFCDNSGAMTQFKELRNYEKKNKHLRESTTWFMKQLRGVL